MSYMDDETRSAEPPAVTYMYSDNGGAACGPCLLTQLRVLWISGHISRDTSLWREGLGTWLPLHALDEVADALLPLSQPPPPGGAAAGEWYHLDAGGQRSAAGLSVEGIARLVASGELDGMSHVWRGRRHRQSTR